MKEEGRDRLEFAIQQLDKEVCPPQHGSWASWVEKEVKSDNEKSLLIADRALMMTRATQQSRDKAIFKILVGSNRLTPSLTNRGWQFWKEPLLTRKERKAVESGVVRWSEAITARCKALQEDYENSHKEDLHSAVILLASLLDIESACRQQLSADLKSILVNSSFS